MGLRLKYEFPTVEPILRRCGRMQRRLNSAREKNTLMASDIPGGFWRAVAEGFISAQLNKPFFGRPYLKLGQCLAGLWPYLFELGGILGAKHAAKPDAFVSAFLGMSGEAGVARRVLVEQANRMLGRHSLGSMKFWDYVGADFADRIGYRGDGWDTLVIERGTQKVPPKVALTNGWEYTSAGAALGTAHPDVLRAMFERTHADVSKEKWQLFYAAGLDIGPEPPARQSYEEAKEEENKNFMEYCRQFHPDLYPVLKD